MMLSGVGVVGCWWWWLVGCVASLCWLLCVLVLLVWLLCVVSCRVLMCVVRRCSSMVLFGVLLVSFSCLFVRSLLIGGRVSCCWWLCVDACSLFVVVVLLFGVVVGLCSLCIVGC